MPHMNGRGRAWWAVLFREAAGADAAQVPDPRIFRDELGHRRDVHGPFLTWRRRENLAHSSGAMNGSASGAPPLDVILWSALAGAPADIDSELARCRAAARVGPDEGALIPQGLHKTIEVWTETELSALHALSRLSVMRRRADWSTLALDAARWHVGNLQPDNATNRPWAIHLFATLALQGSFEAGLLAESLLHSCRVTLGRVDALSAQILLDAAEAIDQA